MFPQNSAIDGGRILELGKNVDGKNQGADQFSADEGDGLGRIGNGKASAHESGVGELQDLGCHSRIFGNDIGDLLQRDIFGLKFRLEFVVEGGRAGNRFEAQDQSTNAGVLQKIAHDESLGQARFEVLGIARLGNVLVSGAEGAQNGFAVGLAGEDHAHDLGIFFFNRFEQLRAVHEGHAHVGDDGVIMLTGQGFDGGYAAFHESHIPLGAHGVQRALQALQDEHFIIHKQ